MNLTMVLEPRFRVDLVGERKDQKEEEMERFRIERIPNPNPKEK
jgi:hypothetical protein